MLTGSVSISPEGLFQTAADRESEFARRRLGLAKTCFKLAIERHLRKSVPEMPSMQDGFSETGLTKPIKLVNNKIHELAAG